MSPVLQVGHFRCGNLWLWRIIEAALECAGVAPRRCLWNHPSHPLVSQLEPEFAEAPDIDAIVLQEGKPFLRVVRDCKVPIDDFDGFLASTTHVWAHFLHGKGAFEHASRFGKVVYIVRDPRDGLVSLAHYVFTPYRRRHYPVSDETPADFMRRNSAWFARSWALHAGEYMLLRERLGAHFVFYERLAEDFDGEFGRLCRYLGLTLTDENRARVREAARLEGMRGRNPGHVRAGVAGRWRGELPPEDEREITRVAGKLMNLLGYSSSAPSERPWPASAVRSALASASRPTVRELLNRFGKSFLARQ